MVKFFCGWSVHPKTQKNSRHVWMSLTKIDTPFYGGFKRFHFKNLWFCGTQLISDFLQNLYFFNRFFCTFYKKQVKNYLENIMCIPCKCCKSYNYHITSVKRKKTNIKVMFFFNVFTCLFVLSTFFVVYAFFSKY